MPVYKSKKQTSDGRCWFFKTPYTVPVSNEQKIMVSKKYATQSDAIQAEHDFLIKMLECKDVDPNMTFRELFNHFLEFKKGEVKFTTYQGYLHSSKHIECFMNTKCVEYNLQQYEFWKNNINKMNFATRHKNDLLKFWKSILNYGSDYYGFNFSSVYRKMNNFTNPNEPKKEMKFYTLDEFKKFLSVEDDIKFRCLWEMLFFCGLRCGEARGLQWNDLDFINNAVSINKQVQASPIGSKEPYIITNPKTRTSTRRIPMCDLLVDDLKSYKEFLINNDLFKSSNFVFGNSNGAIPYVSESVRKRSRKNASLSGVKYIRLHDFRHSCASLLINSGANVTMVSKYLGHSEVEETLNTYSHLFPNALDNVLNIINNLKGDDKYDN